MLIEINKCQPCANSEAGEQSMYLLQRSKTQLAPKRSHRTYSYPDPLSLHWPKGAQVTTVTFVYVGNLRPVHYHKLSKTS